MPKPALANPPREVGGLLRLEVLCGGFLSQLGWGWAGFAFIFVWVFVPIMIFPGLTDFGGKLDVAEGVVLSCDKTRFGDDNEPIYAYRYQFRGPDGVEREGMCFAKGREAQAGSSAMVEYPVGKPDLSRIQGMDSAPSMADDWMEAILPIVFLLVFPLIGVVLIALGVRRGLRANRLLATGAGATARKVSEEPTNTRINNRTVWKYTYEFVGGDGQPHQAVARTHLVEKFSDPEQFVLYDPQQPSAAMLLNDLPVEVRIDEGGQICAARPLVAARVLILPLAAITLHGVIALVVFGV